MIPIANQKVKDFLDEYALLSGSIDQSYRVFMLLLTEGNLTPEQIIALLTIQKEGSCTSSHLAEKFRVKKSSITSIVNRLVDKKLVVRVGDPSDRRNIFLHLTEKGNLLSEEIVSKFYTFLAPEIFDLSDDELATILSSLKKIETILRNVKNKQS